jgi:hypothetical protein
VSEHTYWSEVRSLADVAYVQGRSKEDVRDELVDLVLTADRAGEQWARDTLQRWATRGADADFTRVFKDGNTIKAKRRDGRTVRKTVAYSMPVRSSDGDIVAWQPQLWWDLPLIDLVSLRHRLARQADDLDTQVETLDRIIDAMKRHPQCGTAAQAWVLDGHSLDEIDLANVA